MGEGVGAAASAKKLIDVGGTSLVQQPDAHGRTPLHWAAIRGQVAIARMLLQAGALREARDASGLSALDVARSKGRAPELVRLLEPVS